MPNAYFPHSEKIAYVKASDPHPKNTQYKISIGSEVWGGESHEVVKVQMLYGVAIAGSRSPSYPLGTDDLQRFIKKAEELIANR